MMELARDRIRVVVMQGLEEGDGVLLGEVEETLESVPTVEAGV